MTGKVYMEILKEFKTLFHSYNKFMQEKSLCPCSESNPRSRVLVAPDYNIRHPLNALSQLPVSFVRLDILVQYFI